jgi:hypothetical protein
MVIVQLIVTSTSIDEDSYCSESIENLESDVSAENDLKLSLHLAN